MSVVCRPLAILAALLLGACSGVIQRSTAPPTPVAAGDFATLQADPVPAAGSYVVLGGEILETRRSEGAGTTLLILHRPFSQGEHPSIVVDGDGLFGVRYDDTLDPHLFYRGQLVTVGGLVRGEKPAPGGNAADPALWIDGLKIQLWDRPEWSLRTRLTGQKEWRPWWYDPYYGDRPWWW